MVSLGSNNESHAEVPLTDYSIPDPPLTEFGHQQCAILQQALKAHPLGEKIDLIVVSPFRRTVQTALEGLEWAIERGVKVVPNADWQGKQCYAFDK